MLSDKRPSIIFVTADRKIDRRTLLEADSLKSQGWKTKIVAMPNESSVKDSEIIQRIGSDQQIPKKEARVLQAYSWIRKKIPMNSRTMRFLKKMTWIYLVDPETFYLKLFLPTLKKERADVFLAVDLPTLPVVCQVAKGCGAKIVYDSHELYCEQEMSRREKNKWLEIEKRYIGMCDAVITINESVALELKTRYELENTSVILNADHVPEFIEKSRLLNELGSIDEKKHTVLFQGGFSSNRNLENLVLAMQYVQKNVVLVMLGEGVLENKLKRLAAKHCPDQVVFIPAVPQNELLKYSASADLGIIPYQAICLNNYLCTPNKLFEFMAAGTPILASDLPELRRFVKEKGVGQVCDLGEPKKIADEINKCFQNSQVLDGWRKRVKEIRTELCWETEEKKFLKILEGVL